MPRRRLSRGLAFARAWLERLRPAGPLSRRHVAAVVSLVVCAGLAGLWLDEPAIGKTENPASERESSRVTALPLPLPARSDVLAPGPGRDVVLPAPAGDAEALPEPEPDPPVVPDPVQRVSLEVKSGDSLDRLFRRHELSVGDLHRLLALEEVAPHLKRIQPGDTIEVAHDGPAILSLTRRITEDRSLLVEAGEAGFVASFLEHPVEIRRARATGRITSSFYAAGLAAGLSDGTIMRLAGIYAWDIDFALDIRGEDWFAVVYEEIWQDGEKLRDGEIVAAEFNNRGRSYRAVRFPDEDGRASYYTPEGDNMRKAFLRAPVDFTRVSSNFNPNRLHPILKTRRPHQGVDYAARIGTPIMAAGDGRVLSAGTKGGYGRTVVLQHGDNVTTLYAHMSRIAVRGGQRVKQGDIIGYVGMTGLATAPHLHYEYRVNGVHKNPRTVDLPKAEPVPAARREAFAAATRPLVAELEVLGPRRLAAADTP
nr:peptidoglycan DD-metalloendopeptidase family protein [Wenzhouxiangella sp. XN24]